MYKQREGSGDSFGGDTMDGGERGGRGQRTGRKGNMEITNDHRIERERERQVGRGCFS